jgi:hypothetical protein
MTLRLIALCLSASSLTCACSASNGRDKGSGDAGAESGADEGGVDTGAAQDADGALLPEDAQISADASGNDDASAAFDLCSRRDLSMSIKVADDRHLLSGACSEIATLYPIAFATGRGEGGDWLEPALLAVGCDPATGSVLALGLSTFPRTAESFSEASVLYIDANRARHVNMFGATGTLTRLPPGSLDDQPMLDEVYEGTFEASLSGGLNVTGDFRVCAVTGRSQAAYYELVVGAYGKGDELFQP